MISPRSFRDVSCYTLICVGWFWDLVQMFPRDVSFFVIVVLYIRVQEYSSYPSPDLNCVLFLGARTTSMSIYSWAYTRTSMRNTKFTIIVVKLVAPGFQSFTYEYHNYSYYCCNLFSSGGGACQRDTPWIHEYVVVCLVLTVGGGGSGQAKEIGLHYCCDIILQQYSYVPHTAAAGRRRSSRTDTN